MLHRAFIEEIEHEASLTRKVFERLHSSGFDWRPHEKSYSLRDLASHIANMPRWITATLTQPELDFATSTYKEKKAESPKELVKVLDESVEEALKALKETSDEQMTALWALRHGDKVIFEWPRTVVLRRTVLNHWYHHRGQMTVYMRLNEIPVPGIYGPTADEPTMAWK